MAYYMDTLRRLQDEKKKKKDQVYVVSDEKGKSVNQERVKIDTAMAPIQQKMDTMTSHRTTGMRTIAKQKDSWVSNILQVPEVFKGNFDRFDDGWQFGDLTKTTLEGIGDTALTIGGTVADAGMGVVKGILNVGEGIGDAITYGTAQVLDWTGKDERADELRERASKDIFNEAFKKPQGFVNKASVLGDTSDNVTEGIGYMASIWATGQIGGAVGGAVAKGSKATKALSVADKAAKVAKATKIGTTLGQSGLIFTNSTGTNMADIYDQYGVDGVTDGEAWGKSLGSASVETATELMFGFFGNADAKIVNGMANRAKTALGSVLSRAGGQALGEGFEEVIAYAGNWAVDRVVDAASKGEGAKFAQEWSWEDLWEQAGTAALTALVMGGGQTTMSTINNKTATNTWGDAISETARQQNASAQVEDLNDEIADIKKQIKETTDATQLQELQTELEWKQKQLNTLQPGQYAIPTNTTAPDNTAQIEGLQNAIAEETKVMEAAQDTRAKQISQEKINNLQEELNEATNAQQITNTAVEETQTDVDKNKDNLGREVKKEIQEELKDSKVRDDNGNLLTMYHGTPNGGFTEFDISKRGTSTDIYSVGDYGKGIYFTPVREGAESYTKSDNVESKNPQVYETYLNLKNPLRLDVLSDIQKDMNALSKEYGALNIPDTEIDKVYERYNITEEQYEEMSSLYDKLGDNWQDVDISEYGYDGIINENRTEYVVFDPKQIKILNNNENKSDNTQKTEKQAEAQEVMTEEEYLASKGYGAMGYAEPGLHKSSARVSQNIRDKQANQVMQKAEEYDAKREELRQEYQAKVESGEIRQPTKIESLLKTAQGHEDNKSVQAARRLLEKRGIDWQTGEKIAEKTKQGTKPTQEEIINLLDIQKNKSGSEYANAFFALRDKYGQTELYKALNEQYSKEKNIQVNTTEQIEQTIEEAIAPLQETVEKLTEQVQEKIEGITEQLNTVVNSIEDIQAPVSQEVVEKQNQEAFETITDNEAPKSFEDTVFDVFDNEVFGYETESKVESPFDTRDIDEVGKRNVKAYQYENPEVRPYFQAEAENMMYDLNNTIKGEKNFNDQLYYDTNGEQGWYGTTRQTTEAIAYLKDKYGYSYAQIEKGLNDIIEDNGKENNAVAKRIEFMLDERLRDGYTTSDGIPIPPNEEYIKFLEEKNITEYNREISSTLTDENVPPEQARIDLEPEIQPSEQVIPMAENIAQNRATGQFELKIDESMPVQENTAQNQNTGLSDTSTEAQEQAKVAQILSEAPTKQNKDQRMWARARAAFFDKGSVFEDISLKTKNRELEAKWDYSLPSEARAQNVLFNGYREFDSLTKTITQTSKGLYDIQAEVGDRVQEFSEYLYHKHNIDRMSIEANAQARMAELQETVLKDYDLEGIEKLSRKRQPSNIDKKNGSEQLELDLKIQENLINSAKEYMRLSEAKNKPVFGDSVTAEVSQKVVDEYEMNNPEFMDWANDVYDYNKANLKELVKSGVISQETADQFAEIYPHYVPIARANVNGNAINVPLDTNRTGVNAPIARAKGGNQDILPLFDTMARRTLQTYRATAKNNFGIELKNTLNSTVDNQQTSVDEILENVDQQESLLQEGKNGQNPTFTVFENGEKVTYEITQDIYDALKPVSEGLKGNILKGIPNKISNFHRGLLTEYNPVFMLTNAIKDAQDILLNSQHATKTYAKLPEAYAQIIKKGYWYQEYMSHGGEQNSYFDSQEGTFDTERKGISKVLDLPPLKQISQLNNFIEVAPRLAEYIASREAGRSVETSMLDAARVTTNFKAGGDITKWINRNGATFLNASIQGAMQQVRNVREANAKGLRGYANLAAKFALAGLPAMILNGLLWEDDDDYEELSDYVKQNYYIIGKYGDGNFIRIPKGRMITVVQEGLNQMKNLVTGNDEADLGQFLEIVGNNIAPNNPIENNVLAPIIQAVKNKTWYGGELVPTRLQDEPIEEQYDETTDKISIFLGQKLGISPYKINYVLDQYSGGVGDVFLPMMTQQAETGSDSLLEELMSPLTNKFTVDSVMKNQNVSDLYSKSEELTSKANSTSATDEDILKNKYLNSIKSEMNELYKEKREIQNSSLSNSEKYAQTREIQDQINSMAKNAIDNYENIRRSGDYAKVGNKEYYLKDDTWNKVKDEELSELNSLGMDIADKNTYFNLKTEISGIKDSSTENKKAAIATAIRDTSFTDEQKAYIYGKNYSSDETLDMVLNTGMSFNEYLNYASQEFVADKDSDGKSISGSRKTKVISYINSLNLNIPQKAMLIRKEYSTFDDYNEDIISYVIELDLAYEEKKAILEEVGMKVSADGRISW